MNWTSEELLQNLGLQAIPDRKDAILPILGLLGVGIAIGAGLGLLYAKKPGRELRADLVKNAEDLKDRLPEVSDIFSGRRIGDLARLPHAIGPLTREEDEAA
jgi:hypothetical protein